MPPPLAVLPVVSILHRILSSSLSTSMRLRLQWHHWWCHPRSSCNSSCKWNWCRMSRWPHGLRRPHGTRCCSRFLPWWLLSLSTALKPGKAFSHNFLNAATLSRLHLDEPLMAAIPIPHYYTAKITIASSGTGLAPPLPEAGPEVWSGSRPFRDDNSFTNKKN